MKKYIESKHGPGEGKLFPIFFAAATFALQNRKTMVQINSGEIF
jgi:hypothetical protein